MGTLRKRKCFEKSNPQMVAVLAPNIIRKVRVYFRDPYSTDLDSSDDEERSWSSKTNQSFRVVNTTFVTKRSSHERLRSRKPALGSDSIEEVRTKPVEVRQRWGKWAAEIRNPINKSGTWLGTFPSVEEVESVFDGKQKEFKALTSKKSLNIDIPKPSDFDNFFWNEEENIMSEMEICSLDTYDGDFYRKMEFGSMINNFGKLYDDYCGVDDLPKCDFDICGEEFAFFDDHQQTLINVPCT